MNPGTQDKPFLPYGPWVTLALTGAVLVISGMMSQMLMLAVGAELDPSTANDPMLAYGIIANLLGIAAIMKLADWRAPGRATSYLAIQPFDRDMLWRWIAIAGALFATEWIVEAVVRPAFDIPPPQTWLDGVPFGALLVLTVIITGPVLEELLFRGFLLEGLLPTRLGQAGALTLSALAWTLLHFQYDLLSLLFVFALGIIFGLARLATGSLLPAILLHVAWNALWMLLTYV
ncbi:CPBP family intramembrane glutamic endopeptidase [Emcibacter sp. SYSU 3D8]|uniref:CPBP family intramembrane glutamic endopeptidase n=1 Tax=Emcibacter sp. SYSU 3D8 TaxID=3133969 RepID=UPI0031FEFC01